MANTVTILTNRNKVSKGAVAPIAINVMDDQDFRSGVVAAIVALPFVGVPRISSIISSRLLFQGPSFPIFDSTFITAVFPPAGAFFQAAFNKIELFIARAAVSVLSSFDINYFVINTRLPSTNIGALPATKPLFGSMAFLGNKFLGAFNALINNVGKFLPVVFFKAKMMAMYEFGARIFCHSSTAAATYSRLLTSFIVVEVCHGA